MKQETTEERLKDIANTQGDYIVFLTKELARTAYYLHTHGQGPSEEVIQEGIYLRRKIEKLKTDPLNQGEMETNLKQGI